MIIDFCERRCFLSGVRWVQVVPLDKYVFNTEAHPLLIWPASRRQLLEAANASAAAFAGAP